MKILIIDNGGNVASLKNLLNFYGYESKIFDKYKDLDDHDLIFIPGISSFDNSVIKLKNLGIFNYLSDHNNIKNKKIIGICAGMQVLFKTSEEGNEKGLSLVDGAVKKFKNLHMGWNEISSKNFTLKKDQNEQI